jgi:spermidine synthase
MSGEAIMTDLTAHDNVRIAGHSAMLHQPPPDRVDQPRRSASAEEARTTERRWLEESPNGPAGQRLRADRTVFAGTSEHQDIWVFDNPTFGRVLALDGYVQTTTRDEFIYHEMMAHVPMFAHGGPRDVLVIGGGDGGVLREVLRHRTVRSAVVVEIDQQVIDACRAHLPSLSDGAFADPRTKIVVDEGSAYLRRTSDMFDVILIDSPDPVGPGQSLFSKKFLSACRARLRPGGILAAQGGVSFMQTAQIRRTVSRLRELFRDVSAYTAAVPTYYGGAMAFICATDTPQKFAVSEQTLVMRFAAARIRTECYTPALHLAAFALPRYLADLLWRSGPRRAGQLISMELGASL